MTHLLSLFLDRHQFRTSVALVGLLAVLLLLAPHAVAGVAIEGVVLDSDTGDPIPFATIQQVGTDRATSANADGRYRLMVEALPVEIKFSHIAYYSQSISVGDGESAASLDVSLKTNLIDVGTMKVYSRRLDPGQQIIVEAIKRKKDILTRIHDYRYDAYVKVLITDETKDSSEIFLLTESQTTAYWEQPDKYKEVITARRQSANIEAENNITAVGDILNFNSNRINIGSYSIVTPTAEDALDHYNYYLLDTLYIDDLPVYRLEIEPKNPDEALFVGYIDIADDTYDVVAVEVGASRGLDIPFLVEPRYSQRFAKFGNDYWMPIEIRYTTKVDLNVPIPGLPNLLGVTQAVSLYSYQFDVGHPKGTFDEYRIEVERSADEVDSVAWNARQTIPLTETEKAAYVRIDSVESKPKSFGKQVLGGVGRVLEMTTGGGTESFRFNRVEGTYLGLGFETDRFDPRLRLRFGTGYAFKAERMENLAGFTYRLNQQRRLDVGFDFRNKIVRRPTVISSRSYDPSILALFARMDPFDYYRVRGFSGFVSFKPINQTRLRFGYNDYDHYTEQVNTNYSFLRGDDRAVRWNPTIEEGKFRSVEAAFRYDSRKMFNNKGREQLITTVAYTTFTAGIEYASPDFIDNDFDFRRYYVEFGRRQRTLGLGVTTMRLYAGASDGDLPPQRYFTVDHGNGFFYSSSSLSTMDETNFYGNRVLALKVDHNFRRQLFIASGLPLIKDIPFWLSLQGGVFWTEFKNQTVPEECGPLMTAEKPYSEFGFNLGNLTPFLTPFNFSLSFTWQLSDYDTDDFYMGLSLDL